jgi:hypothetical protein
MKLFFVVILSVFLQVLEDFEARGSNSEALVHVINMNVVDNPEVCHRVSLPAFLNFYEGVHLGS